MRSVRDLIINSKILKVYVGKDGCRCGCGGRYYTPNPNDLEDPVDDILIQALEAVEDGAKVEYGQGWVNIVCSPDRVYTVYYEE